MKSRGSYRGIRRDDADHRCHVRHDHARALAHAAYRKLAIGIFELAARIGNGILLRMRIGGHDGPSGIGTTLLGKLVIYRRNTRLEALDTQLLANHAG